MSGYIRREDRLFDPITGALAGYIDANGNEVANAFLAPSAVAAVNAGAPLISQSVGVGRTPVYSQDATNGRRVFSSNAFSSWSGSLSTAPGTVLDGSAISFGDGEPVFKMTFASSVGATTRATRNTDGYATAGTNLKGRTITIPVYVTDPGRIRQFFLYLTSQASDFSTFAAAALDQGNAESLVPGVNYLKFHCTDASVLTAWAMTGGETFVNPIKQFRIAVTTIGTDCGPVYIGAPRVSAKARATVIIGFDDGWATQLSHSSLGFDGACEYLRRRGLRASLYVPGSLLGQANYLTLAQVQELYADGFDVCNHTVQHSPFNTSYTLGSALVGATSMTISAASAPGTENASRVMIDVPSNSGDNLHLALVTGVRSSDGAAVTEMIPIGLAHGAIPSSTVFSSVSSIALKEVDGTTAYTALGAISARWTMPVSEMMAGIVDGQNFLLANGMPRAAGHFCYPRGEYNPEAVAVLGSLGMLTARTTTVGAISAVGGVISNKYQMPAKVLGGSANTSARMIGVTDAAIDQGSAQEVSFHTFVTGTPANGTETKWADFTAWVDDLAAKKKAGLVDVLTKSEFYARYTFVN